MKDENKSPVSGSSFIPHPSSFPNRAPAYVICIGNPYRGDDAAGLRVARLLKEKASRDFKIIEASGEGAALIEAWADAVRVIIVDAVVSSAEPGTVHRLDVQSQSVPQGFFRYSTHAFGLAEAIELARALDRLPASMIVYGIEGKSFDAGDALSEEVERAAREVAERVLREVETDRRPNRS
ncbi:MAG: hydrogenase maturation protease [Blastocatellia bacterium]|nr:hydrogenase maturation protease [Blastocatellia bacterium]